MAETAQAAATELKRAHQNHLTPALRRGISDGPARVGHMNRPAYRMFGQLTFRLLQQAHVLLLGGPSARQDLGSERVARRQPVVCGAGTQRPDRDGIAQPSQSGSGYEGGGEPKRERN